jgi:2-keto-3-deoxy-L-rhamnonate aldolase RhmA
VDQVRAQVAVFVKIAHPAVTRILAALPSVNSLILDGEHGSFGDSDLETLCALARAFEKTTIVRVPDANPITIARALDRGADGVMIPRVETVAQVKRAVAGLQIPPDGNRGWDPTVAADNYGTSDERWRRVSQPRCLVQIETRGALEKASALARIKGVTDLFVGPADLSRALGSRSEVYTARVKRAMEQLPSVVRGSGVTLGAFVDSPERAEWAFQLGYRFLAVVPDTVLIARAARSATEPLAALMK